MNNSERNKLNIRNKLHKEVNKWKIPKIQISFRKGNWTYCSGIGLATWNGTCGASWPASSMVMATCPPLLLALLKSVSELTMYMIVDSGGPWTLKLATHLKNSKQKKQLWHKVHMSKEKNQDRRIHAGTYCAVGGFTVGEHFANWDMGSSSV